MVKMMDENQNVLIRDENHNIIARDQPQDQQQQQLPPPQQPPQFQEQPKIPIPAEAEVEAAGPPPPNPGPSSFRRKKNKHRQPQKTGMQRGGCITPEKLPPPVFPQPQFSGMNHTFGPPMRNLPLLQRPHLYQPQMMPPAQQMNIPRPPFVEFEYQPNLACQQPQGEESKQCYVLEEPPLLPPPYHENPSDFAPGYISPGPSFQENVFPACQPPPPPMFHHPLPVPRYEFLPPQGLYPVVQPNPMSCYFNTFAPNATHITTQVSDVPPLQTTYFSPSGQPYFLRPPVRPGFRPMPHYIQQQKVEEAASLLNGMDLKK